ncbi:MAG TPA: hypothetical protein VIN08_17920 [Ohtaekwangia sp.]|uniref:hypothetical protein n=1 Tax=Ohtaekwangia sp. TaxID=2066019 RepID=UPI002F937B0E
MRDFQFWLYVIIGAIYLLGRLRKKPEQQQDIPSGNPEKPARQFELPTAKPAPAREAKPLTFEELLKEITESKTSSQEKPIQEYVDYDDVLEEEEKDLEDVEYSYRKQDNIYEVYDEAKRQAFNRPSLEETMKIEDTVVKYEKFKMFEQQQSRDLVQQYLADFKDPDGLKKAVVMSEILQRKF